jgi:hypothetical protein
MRLLATLAILTLLVAASSAVPALANHTPSAEDSERIANALWLSSIETAEQAYDVSAAQTDQPQRVEIQDLDVKMTPTDIYIIRWYTDE